MAERWQQWMPFHIDRFRGSPEVQAMHPAARAGYLYLLGSAWQTDDCSLSADPLDLATESGLGDELWALHSARILRNFQTNEVTGRLYNRVLVEEWLEAKRVFEQKFGSKMTNEELSEKRRQAGKAGAEKRWQKDGTSHDEDGKPMANCHTGIANASQNDGYTGTGTDTGTKPQKQKPSRPAKAERVPDPRHTEFRDAFRKYFLHKNPGLTQEPWDPQEASHLARFLKKNPAFTTEQWKSLLNNRARSNVIHAENLSAWIARALTWAMAPTQPTGGFTNGKPTLADSIAAKQSVLDARAARRMADGADHNGRALEAGSADSGQDGTGGPAGSLSRAS